MRRALNKIVLLNWAQSTIIVVLFASDLFLSESRREEAFHLVSGTCRIFRRSPSVRKWPHWRHGLWWGGA